MTRTQVNTIKEKMSKGGTDPSKRQSRAARQHDLHKEKLEKEKQERAKRLEKRM